MAFIGIDLGTTNSLVAVWQNNESILIPNVHGEYLTPSVISLNDDGQILIGKIAKERLVTHSKQTVSNFKRLMGTSEKVIISNKSFSPEELSALVLKQLKADAEAFLNEAVDEAVISVPAYFNDNQRNATRVAATLAGLHVERLINEPTAAAIAYGVHEKKDEKSFIVIDLGGGTFDVSIMEKFDDLLEVHASAGDSFLGGEDFTLMLMHHFLAKHDIELCKLTSNDHGRLYHLFDQVKCRLSDQEKVDFDIVVDGKSLPNTLIQDELYEIFSPLLKRLLKPIEQSIHDAKLDLAEIDDVFLVGGATRMKTVRQFITRLFNRFPSCHINPDHVVAMGAAIQAALKQRNQALKDVVLTDVCPFSLGIEVASEGPDGSVVSGIFSVIIERNTTIPASRVENFCTVKDHQVKILIKIFQGENRLVKHNILLGEFEVAVPPKQAGLETVDIRFTYDINGLLEVIATLVSTAKASSIVIQNSSSRLSTADIEVALKKLEILKIHPRDNDVNQAILARAERLYQERLGAVREKIGQAIMEFEHILNSQDPRAIERSAKSLEQYLNTLERDFWI
ncbi:MAG: molecular chaperone HscC [Thalassolituus sp.]|uniref:Hsp70 family protein n=1 Tax=Thalassolituus sp. TaxID=2030822 RepID=UPI003982C3CB